MNIIQYNNNLRHIIGNNNFGFRIDKLLSNSTKAIYLYGMIVSVGDVASIKNYLGHCIRFHQLGDNSQLIVLQNLMKNV